MNRYVLWYTEKNRNVSVTEKLLILIDVALNGGRLKKCTAVIW
jgi:hypothetical protein